MTVNELKTQYVPTFFTLAEFKEIIIYITNKSDLNFVMDNQLSKEESDLFLTLVNNFKSSKKPIAYLTGNKYFYKFDFFVNENVLIPRPETELIVDEILKYDINEKNIFDICCGSGCIGITVKNINSKFNLVLSDISEKALEVAKINLKKFNQKATVLQADFLDVFKKTNIIPDIIAINPPYIDISDQNISENVKKYEPNIALFAKNNGLEFYKILFNSLDDLFKLNKKLIIICEFGFQQKKEIKYLFSPLIVKYRIDFKKDYSNNWRVFTITSKENYE
ncbi:peptide chain release factor N(5)-glutamine methyltransferase [Spiroplasma diminutum]|uniref:peptide chain release factor N(5)-glutamine methyltransferase n=1 Tax=Spiroplasma diminutum CUAS-1 TaxID=1276221 RepID=S5MFD8_9MOLU|nr:peptide chain release factor N(5)-glutamine methyltransferase [Spiroplasma diminutum]AGR42513.1 N5-glutamine S-adenosyl-L-methionine-dependent methyltransferase [Spiroplasma diminutum CUAS-1]